MTRRIILSHFSHVQLCATLWTIACQAPLSMGILQTRILEWVAMPSSRGSSWSRDRNCVSCISGHGVSLKSPACPWDSPGKNTAVGCHDLLRGIFPTQRSNSHLLPSPALAGGFFTTSTTWEGQKRGRKIVLKHCWSKIPHYFLQFHRIHNKRCLKWY